ncbi:hypothetical protein [Cellulophaga omnivescoria]|uniref:hypothetical protein n=1 Tax=Cellulophaga omnivescoria TaxID=1888890 RepID=UPI0022F0BC6A|nr:hypothetical protein [Cellulophaga omnivescoria]WBU88118.1 hypothetical protein PBN93_09555 [Cellulophaga omnivescoria]
MTIKTYALLFFLFLVNVTGTCQYTQETDTTSHLKSGFYILNDSVGVKVFVPDFNKLQYVNTKTLIPITAIKKCSTVGIDATFRNTGEKQFGLNLTFTPKGDIKMQIATDIAFEERKSIGLFIDNKIINAFYVNSKIRNGNYFLALNLPFAEIKKLEKKINSELKKKK